MSEPSVVTFGGCQINGPIRTLNLQRRLVPVYRQIGFRSTPFVFTPRAALQLIRFCAGEQSVPREVREFCYSDPELEPGPAVHRLIRQVDFALLEPNTAIDIVFEGYYLNSNIVQQAVVERAKEIDVKFGKLAHRWKADGILKQNEDIRADMSAQLLAQFPAETPEDEMVRALIRDCRGQRSFQEDLFRQVGELLEILPVPTGVVLYTFQYMPDGRAISWPAEFKDDMTVVARRLGLKLLDPSSIVVRYGTSVSLREDLRHFKDEFYPVVGEVLMDYMQEIKESQAPVRELAPAL